jgi:hypothetical protein
VDLYDALVEHSLCLFNKRRVFADLCCPEFEEASVGQVSLFVWPCLSVEKEKTWQSFFVGRVSKLGHAALLQGCLGGLYTKVEK